MAIKSTEEWYAERKKGIGASEASAVIGLSPYLTNVDLWRMKTGRKQAPDISSKEHVMYGHAAEAPIRQLFALDYPEYEVIYGGEFDLVRNSEHPFILATLDGRLIEKATGRKGILEIKTTEILRSSQKEKWQAPDGSASLPQNYYVQCVQQLLATGFDFVVLHAQLKRNYKGEVRTERRTYFIERAEVLEDIEYLKAEELKFWNEYVVADKEPPLLLPEI